MKQPAHSSNTQAPAAGTRTLALKLLHAVIVDGRSLSTLTAQLREREARERAQVMELVYGVLRWRWKLDGLLHALLDKPLKAKEQRLRLILLLALYELVELHTPDYAVVDQAVKLCRRAGRKWASGMVNAVLRNYIRDPERYLATLDHNDEARFSHPRWLIECLRQDWPAHWQQILEANNQRPPFWLRVNVNQFETGAYRSLLQQQGIDASPLAMAEQALLLTQAQDVSQLPGFEQGAVSVQDAGAQLAAELLQLEPGQRVLDLCAAPGGKTCHLLEREPALAELVAVELDAGRMQRVEDNLQRLDLQATLVVADATDPTSWWNGDAFDRILVDAPCSASGVIRRHPDIKSLRRAEDLPALCELQARILEQAWSMLAAGGELLYVTCSVLRQENEQQLALLLDRHADAAEIEIEADWGQACRHGRQLLPGEHDCDGFFFARLRKTAT